MNSKQSVQIGHADRLSHMQTRVFRRLSIILLKKTDITVEIGLEDELTTDKEPRTSREKSHNASGAILHVRPYPACGSTREYTNAREMCENVQKNISDGI